jgi:2-keto-4-pentenoate hydratase/2-oxohepta-3-ene-1,7-dioic acid hydratase in catechol pathway
MKLVKVERDGATAQGVLVGEDVRIVGGWRSGPAATAPFTLGGMPLEALKSALDQSSESAPLSGVTLAVPVDPGAKILCAGVNYRDHASEVKADEAANPILFARFHDSLVAQGQPIIRPSISDSFDYEGEIAVVIGKRARNVALEDAMGLVAGYSCFMDGSVREYQRHALMTGKNFWRSGAMGPWIVTPDEIGDRDVRLQTFVAGEEMQSARASQMIFSIAQLISYSSRMTWLKPSDVIATGTPGGVGSRKTPPRWLKVGETVEVVIESVGRLSNRVQDDA